MRGTWDEKPALNLLKLTGESTTGVGHQPTCRRTPSHVSD